jgi:intracellular multiplication protein IcmE
MRAASFTAAQLREAGCDLLSLRDGGCSFEQLRLCGFSAGEIMRQCGASIGELRVAGYSACECLACGIPVDELSSITTLSGRLIRHSCCKHP